MPINNNSFGTFLENLDGRSKGETNDAPPLEILRLLETTGRTSVQELMSRLGMDVMQLAKTISEMKEAGLIELEGTGGNQMAKLTQTGSAVLKMRWPST